MIKIFLSSFKKGYGIEELLSNNHNDFWCSDASLPHGISILFNKKIYVYSVDLCFMFSKDESYTPEELKIFFNESENSYKIKKQSFIIRHNYYY